MNDILHLLVGTYTTGNSEGIYTYRFDLNNGNWEYVNMVEVENPSYLVSCRNSKYVYAISEHEDKPSVVSAFHFDSNREELNLLNSQPTIGDGPCNVTIDYHRNHVLTANYEGGSITVFDINTYGPLYEASQFIEFEGSSSHPHRQEKSHIHDVKFSPDNKYIFATDLGADRIYRFEVDKEKKEGCIKRNTQKSFPLPPGSGPRHFLFHPCGEYLYLINELASTVMAFSYKNGNLKEFQSIEIHKGSYGGGGDIRICPNGHFLYASNRLKDDGIAIYYIDHLDGRLTKVGYQRTGIHPRNLSISPNGKFLLAACKDSQKIEIYNIDQTTGLLSDINKAIKVDMPVCLEFI